MKKWTSIKYRNIYLFITILSFIGFISGYNYYRIQDNSLKDKAIESLNLKENLNKPVNNIIKNGKKSIKPIIYGALIFPQIINIVCIFYEPFQIGFIFNLLCTYNFRFSFIYIFIYHLIPLAILLFLIKISFAISKDIIKYIVLKNQSDKKHLKLLIKKYIIILLLEIVYETLLLFFSTNINAFLISII